MKLAKAMMTVAGLTGLSRIAGFTRDILTAAILGAGPVSDAFFVALKLPNFFRRVTAEGAFSVSFVPIYSETIEREGDEEARNFASNAFMVMLCGLFAFTVLALLAMPWMVYGVAPGFEGGGERYELAVDLSRITFPYLLFMSLTALMGGVLNTHDRFAPFAFAPVLFNVCLIAALLWANAFETPGHALAWGIAAAGVIQLVWLWEAARYRGLHLKLRAPKFNDPKIIRVLKLMGPGVIGAGVMHINLFADLIIASFLDTGSISYLYYADRLNQLPLGVVGIAVGTALLPMLSRSMAKGDVQESRDLFNRALEFCLILALPAAAALAVMPETLISVLFERGAFEASDTKVTAVVLSCYAIGLPAYIAIKVFSTAHWARQDTKTPVKISIAATITNIIMSLILIWYMGVAGIALATGLTAWMQFIMHIQALKGHEAATFDDRFKRIWPRIILASCIMAAGLYYAASALQFWVQGSVIEQIVALIVLVLGGAGLYGLALTGLGAVKLSDIKKYLKKK